MTLARFKANPQKKTSANNITHKPHNKSQDYTLPASPSKPSKRVLDDESTAAASKGSSKFFSKKRKDDTESTQKANMARQSEDKESIDGDEEEAYDLSMVL